MPDITITQPALPADLPENWTNSQYVSAGGTETGLSQQHGYNYLMKQVNDAQNAVNTLAGETQTELTTISESLEETNSTVEEIQSSVGDLEKGGYNATATREGTTVAITGPENADAVTFIAPADWTAGDTYTYNGIVLTLTDLNNEPVEDGWKQGAPIVFYITGGNRAFFKSGGGRYKPTDLPPLNPNFTMEISEGDSEDTVTVTADKLTISPTTDMLAGGQWEYGTEMSPAPGKGQNIKHWTREQLVTSGKLFDGLLLGDVTASDAVNETILWLPENQNGETVLVPFIVLSTDYLGGCLVLRKNSWTSSNFNGDFEGSNVDTILKSTYSNSVLSESVFSSVLTVSLPCWESENHSYNTKIFILSMAELNFGTGGDIPVEGTAMPYFNTADRRKTSIDGQNSVSDYWSRTNSTTRTSKYFVDTSGQKSSTSSDVSKAVRPAFVLPKDFQIQQRPDGSYTVYNDYGLITLKDVKVSDSSSVTKIHVRENSGVYIFDYVSSNYNDSDRGCLFREEALDGTVGTSVTYPSGGAGQGASNWEAALPSSLRNLISEVPIKYKNATSVQETTARAFIPSIDEMYGTETNYGTGTQWNMMKVSANRIRHYNGSPISYWLRDAASSTKVNYMYTSGNYNSDGVNYQKYCVPAFTLPLTAPIRLLADGTYDLVPEDPSLSTQTVSTLAEGQSDTTVTLADIPVSTAGKATIVKIEEEDGQEHDYLVLVNNYQDSGGVLLQRYNAVSSYSTASNDYGSEGDQRRIVTETWVETNLSQMVRDCIIPVTIPYRSSSGSVSNYEANGAFLLSGTEVGGSVNPSTGVAIAYFNSNSVRIKRTDVNSAVYWWTRDFAGGSNNYIVTDRDSVDTAPGQQYIVPAFVLSNLTKFKVDESGVYHFLGLNTSPVVSFSFTVPHGTQPVVRQYTYNYEEHYQTMLEGGVLPALGGDTGPTYSEVLSENTWAQIAQAVADKDPILDVWQVGDTKDEVIAGETLTFAIMGKNMDDLADGSGKAGLTFGMTQLMASTRPMNSSNTNSGSFAGSAMYSWLSGTIYPNLTAELKDAIKAVNKKTSSGGGSSAIRTDPMYLWLFSEIEVFGTTTYSVAGEGTQYPYFATSAERIKRLSNGAGNASYWWERSPRTNDLRNFCSVTPSGAVSYNNADYSRGVCFGFCI